jgi:hypothetical protein
MCSSISLKRVAAVCSSPSNPLVQAVPPAHALWRGPYSYPRTGESYGTKRPYAKLDDFLEDPGGGEGVMKLLKAREKADESWGYEWIHTVFVMKGRSLPTLPTLILAVWTMAVTLILMLLARFDLVLRESYGVPHLPIEMWQRDIFICLKGLEVRMWQHYCAIAYPETRRNIHALLTKTTSIHLLRRCPLE